MPSTSTRKLVRRRNTMIPRRDRVWKARHRIWRLRNKATAPKQYRTPSRLRPWVGRRDIVEQRSTRETRLALSTPSHSRLDRLGRESAWSEVQGLLTYRGAH